MHILTRSLPEESVGTWTPEGSGVSRVGRIDALHSYTLQEEARSTRRARRAAMAEVVPYGRRTQRPPDVAEVHVIWMTGGLSCDGDSVSVPAATQPSLEDVLLGAIPGLPRVHLHNPVLAYEVGDDFMTYWYKAERGELDPFVLVMEGSIPNED